MLSLGMKGEAYWNNAISMPYVSGKIGELLIIAA